jgi:hypothetical protein
VTTLLSDVQQDFSQSPRVTLVLAPRTSLLAQDVVDTLRKIEDSWQGMPYPKLVDASGKESLGSFQVGITYQLQNNQIQFQDRQTPVQTGTITTGSSAAVGGRISVIDASATFQANGVERGSFIINWTDQSIVSVLNVVSETELEVYEPTSGIGNTYDIADDYSVFNVELCDLSGGNSTAVDDLASTISSVVPSVGTYVILAQSSNATIVESVDTAALTAKVDDIHGMVMRSIWVDTTAGVNGSGYQQSPFNNFASAASYAVANDIRRIIIEGNTATIDRSLVRYVITGVGTPNVNMNGQNLNRTEFYACGLSGTMIGVVHAHDCEILTGASGIDGEFLGCILNGSITVGGSADLHLYNCIEGDPVTLTLGAGNSTIHIHKWSGNLTLAGVNGVGDEVNVFLENGSVTIAASCTDGSINVSGMGRVIDNSAGSTIDKTNLLEPSKLLTVKKFLGLK